MLKKRWAAAAAAAAALGLVLLTACGSGGSSGGSGGAITLGFAQVGAESGWRTANTKSIQDSAKAAGIELKFSDAQQKQENQISAIRSYIQQKVDVIAFSPVVETGWDTVLKEAKTANIPVILTDRAIDSPDKSLYKTFLGSDFVAEGKKAGDWLAKEYASTTGPVNIVELEGTTGSAPAIDRKKGFEDVIAADPKFKIVASQTGDFTRAEGKQVMEAFLQVPAEDRRPVRAERRHGPRRHRGHRGGRQARARTSRSSRSTAQGRLQALADGKFNYVVECNPLLGPQLMDLVKKVAAGEKVPARILTQETEFDQAAAKAALPHRQY